MQEIKANINSKIIIDQRFSNINKYLTHKNTIIITDENLYNIYSNKFPENIPTIIIGTGESVKTLTTVEYIINKLIDFNVDRHTFLLGVGGGIVCDITGFVASVYMRGIYFGFVSTSLLSQIDASVGGKNGVNFNSYKNIIGSFNQPKFVICDTQMLKTLPQKEINNGMGEMLKHALIADAGMFNDINLNFDKILKLDNDILPNLIFNNIKIKIRIVEKDENEQNERKKLNFGHTLAHAIEKHSNLSHGEAVAVGIVFASYLSFKKGYINKHNFNEIINTIKKLGLPTSTNINKQKLAEAITKDKKRNNNNIDLILLKNIGNAIIETYSIEQIKTEILNYEL